MHRKTAYALRRTAAEEQGEHSYEWRGDGIESHCIVGNAKDKQGADSLRVPRKAKEMHGRSGQYGEMQRKSIAINRTVGNVERSNGIALHLIDGKAMKRKRKE